MLLWHDVTLVHHVRCVCETIDQCLTSLAFLLSSSVCGCTEVCQMCNSEDSLPSLLVFDKQILSSCMALVIRRAWPYPHLNQELVRYSGISLAFSPRTALFRF